MSLDKSYSMNEIDSRCTNIDPLDETILFMIFQFLNVIDLIKICGVSKLFRHLVFIKYPQIKDFLKVLLQNDVLCFNGSLQISVFTNQGKGENM